MGEKATLSNNVVRVHKRSQAVRPWLGREWSKQTIPDGEALEKRIADLPSQLDRTAQIMVAKDNPLKRLDKEKEKQQPAYNEVQQRM